MSERLLLDAKMSLFPSKIMARKNKYVYKLIIGAHIWAY